MLAGGFAVPGDDLPPDGSVSARPLAAGAVGNFVCRIPRLGEEPEELPLPVGLPPPPPVGQKHG
jgi:hypothetical protein